MIFGIGTDIVEVARIDEVWQRHGRRFAARILAGAELSELDGHAAPARLLAKRFAAKEAFAKAVGTGIRGVVGFHSIAIGHDALGKPLLVFDAALQAYLERIGVVAHHLSVSDERDTVVAFVVLERA